MYLLIYFICFLTLLVLMIWVGGFIYSNDLTLKISSINRIKANKVLVIFPHADDEALSTGGFMSALSSRGTDLRWVIITKGEKGTPDGRIDESLKTIRINESKKAAKVFKVSNLTQGDFPDGGLNSADKKLNEYITKIIDDFNPDLVITYDLSGLYGHPDHIAVSEIVTKVVKNKSKMKLWYVSFPKRILATISLPTHMAKDKNFMKKRMIPTHKIWVGAAGVWNKIQVSYVYQSQGGSSSRNMPIKFIPFWFYISLTPFEYFYEVKR